MLWLMRGEESWLLKRMTTSLDMFYCDLSQPLLYLSILAHFISSPTGLGVRSPGT